MTPEEYAEVLVQVLPATPDPRPNEVVVLIGGNQITGRGDGGWLPWLIFCPDGEQGLSPERLQQCLRHAVALAIRYAVEGRELKKADFDHW